MERRAMMRRRDDLYARLEAKRASIELERRHFSRRLEDRLVAGEDRRGQREALLVPGPSFSGMRVLVPECRRARDLALIVNSYGGRPIVAPAVEEVPLESNPAAVGFTDGVVRGEFDVVVLLTGVGARMLVELTERVRGNREPFLEGLRQARVIARGPKAAAVMQYFAVPVWAIAREPNTWRELLDALDARAEGRSLDGWRVAVQECGVSNPELLAGLEARHASVTSVPVYRWALPDDLDPLREAIRRLAASDIDVVLFTTGAQVRHLLQVADSMGVTDGVRNGLANAVVASIGPSTSGELRRHGLSVDVEASHPKMGFLARETAEHAADVLRNRRA
jgi:uroporphyrinogen-III synthase